MGQKSGVLDERTFLTVDGIRKRRDNLRQLLSSTKIVPNSETQRKLQSLGTPVLTKPITLNELLRRTEICGSDLRHFVSNFDDDPNVLEPLEIDVKYSGYIKRQVEVINQTKKLEKMALNSDLPYAKIRGLSREEVEKLTTVKPRTLGQAQRISGVNPSAIQAILVYLKGIQSQRE